MQFCAEAKAIPTFAALKSDAMNAIVVRQLADRDGENFFGFVKPQRHGRRLAGKKVSANHANRGERGKLLAKIRGIREETFPFEPTLDLGSTALTIRR